MSDENPQSSKDGVLAVFCKPHPRVSELILRIGRDQNGHLAYFQAYRGCTDGDRHSYHGKAESYGVEAFNRIDPREIIAVPGLSGAEVYFHRSEQFSR